MRTLTVIKITNKDLQEHWGLKAINVSSGELFIRCNQKGEINWDKAPVYTWPEIQEERKRRPVHFSSGPKEQWEL